MPCTRALPNRCTYTRTRLHFARRAVSSRADPSYEAGAYAAKTSKAKVTYVKLTPTYAHDVKAMVAADPNAGVIYICNPNNPTGTLTPKEDIVWALENKPKGSILLVDEAYIHLSDAPDTLDLVAAGKDLIVLRTFSKIYGMAGIRCGLALGRPDLLAKLQPFGMNAMPITGSAAANVSLLDAELIPTRKKIIGDTRRDTACMAQGEQLQGHRRLAVQLLHDRLRTRRQRRLHRHEGQEHHHWTHLARLAKRGSHHGGHPG